MGYVANLVWNEYQTKQAHSHPDQSGALVNVDVLDTVLLSLHPKSKLKSQSLSDYTREGLAEMEQFQDLIHMDIHKGYDGYGRRSEGAYGGHHQNMPVWLKNIPDNYTAQLDMETLAGAMAVKKNWDRPQYAILKEMYLDLKRMHYSFRVNRDQSTGKFRPMSEVDGAKFPAKRSNRRDFPDTKDGSKGVGGSKHADHQD